MDPNSFMAASRVAARAEEGRVQRLKEVILPLEQPGHEGDYTPDPDVMATIRQLQPHLQPVLTLMATMVPPSKEDRLWEKRGKDVLALSSSIIMVVSFIVLRNVF